MREKLFAWSDQTPRKSLIRAGAASPEETRKAGSNSGYLGTPTPNLLIAKRLTPDPKTQFEPDANLGGGWTEQEDRDHHA
jgi:hypothetical protein